MSSFRSSFRSNWSCCSQFEITLLHFTNLISNQMDFFTNGFSQTSSAIKWTFSQTDFHKPHQQSNGLFHKRIFTNIISNQMDFFTNGFSQTSSAIKWTFSQTDFPKPHQQSNGLFHKRIFPNLISNQMDFFHKRIFTNLISNQMKFFTNGFSQTSSVIKWTFSQTDFHKPHQQSNGVFQKPHQIIKCDFIR